ncbi:hypothetical protein ACXZ1M_27875 [Duganella sp. PWIR1]
MDNPSIKDYIDAKDESISTEARQYYALTEARLAEMDARVVNRLAEMETRLVRGQADMETRLVRGQAEVLKWCVGIMIAGITITTTVTTSVSVYLYNSTLNRVDAVARQVEVLSQEVRALRTANK